MIEAFLAAIVAVVAAFFAGTMRGKRGERSKQDAAYRDTRKRMDDAEIDFGNDPDAARRWLRERGKSGRDL